jgi:hypothetical protein
MRVQDLAHHFAYPPTPDIAGRVRARVSPAPRRGAIPRRWAQAAAALVIALAGLLIALPQVRAGAWEALRYGAVRILRQDAPDASPSPATATLLPGAIASVLDLPGATTLDQAQAQVSFTLRLPTYPPDLGQPERVFLMGNEGKIVTLVWLDPDDLSQARLILQVMSRGASGAKYYPWREERVTVNERSAAWLPDPHWIDYFLMGDDGQEITLRRYVDGPVLIWEHDRATYRLESRLSREEAIQVAESVR